MKLTAIYYKILDKLNYNKTILTENSFDKYYIKMALLASEKSKDPSTQVGACIVSKNNTILSMGFNGIPMGVNDNIDIYTERYDRDKSKYKFFSHAEENAICFAARNGTSLDGSKIYVTMMPCCGCCRMIIQAGIKEVIVYQNDQHKSFNNRWASDIENTKIMFKEAGIKLKYISKLY